MGDPIPEAMWGVSAASLAWAGGWTEPPAHLHAQCVYHALPFSSCLFPPPSLPETL